MYLVMGITGNVGGATARHLLKQRKEVRALVRNREKAAKWADQGVELVDGESTMRQPSRRRSKMLRARLLCCRLNGRRRLITEKQRP